MTGPGCISFFEQHSAFPGFLLVKAAGMLRDIGFLFGFQSRALKSEMHPGAGGTLATNDGTKTLCLSVAVGS